MRESGYSLGVVVWVQGCSLSNMTAALQCLDPLLTAYLDWRLLLRNLLANALPDLAAASTDSLLQLKQAMQQADSNADGLVAQDELMTVDVSMLLASLVACSDAAAVADADVPSGTEPDGNADEQTGENSETAADVQPESEVQDNEEPQELESAGADGADAAQQIVDPQIDEVPAGDEDLTEAGPDLNKAAEHVKSLLCQALWGDHSTAAVDIDEIMLFLSCAEDGNVGLQKAFEVLTASSEDSQVCLCRLYELCCCNICSGAWLNGLHDCRRMRLS